jgi:hypothetical protein
MSRRLAVYWNSQQIPELAGLKFRERMQVIRRATDQLNTPNKLLLNVVKLILLVPPFMLMARADSALTFVGWLLALLVIYPLATRPLTFSLVQEHLALARRQLGL